MTFSPSKVKTTNCTHAGPCERIEMKVDTHQYSLQLFLSMVNLEKFGCLESYSFSNTYLPLPSVAEVSR